MFCHILVSLMFLGQCYAEAGTLFGQGGDNVPPPKAPEYNSCLDIKKRVPSAVNGMYTITDEKGSIYRTYCDMVAGGGGWTLVASVHEDFLAGKCTTGDRWSSEHGNNAAHPHGDGAWENTKTFGQAESAASDDYKNQGYFNMRAKDVMIWHVNNDALIQDFSNRAFMKYHTSNGFLKSYGGNLYKLYRGYFPLRDKTYPVYHGNGPAPRVVWVRGDNSMMVQNTPPEMRAGTAPGYIQFRAINYERSAFALCPGLKIISNYGHVEHVCIGGTSYHRVSGYCGDFAAKDWNGYATGKGASSNQRMTESVVMIFYR